jgi:hypothetical protein
LARRWQQLDAEIAELDAHLDELTAEAAPTLRALNGVGPQNAAERLRSAASFAALCGASPIDASSGRQQRHRLNRGGDRQANCALYAIVMCRLRWHQPTKDYMARGISERTHHQGSDPLPQALRRQRSTPRHQPRPQPAPPPSNAHESPLDIQRSIGSMARRGLSGGRPGLLSRPHLPGVRAPVLRWTLTPAGGRWPRPICRSASSRSAAARAD